MSENNPLNDKELEVTEVSKEEVIESTIFVKHEYNDKKVDSKRKRTIKKALSVSLSLVLIAALVVGITCWNKLFPKSDDNNSTASSLTYAIMSLDPNSVSTIRIQNAENDFVIKANDDEKAFWVVDGVDPSLTSAELIDSFVVGLVNLEVENMVTDSCDDLAFFGLAEPSRTATITLSDGTQHVVKVGKNLPMSTGCYVMLDDNNKVYSTSNAVIQYYDHYKEDFAELSIYEAITAPSGSDNYYNNGVLAKYDYIKLSGEMFSKPIEFGINSGASQEFLPYVLKTPYARTADSEIVTKMIEYFESALKGDSMLCYNAGKIEREALGFDKPLAVFEVKAAGVTRKYTLGKTLTNVDNYYTLMVDDRSQIYTVSKDSLAFITSDITEYFSDQIVMEDIYGVKKLTIKDESGSYVFDLAHSETTSDDGSTTKTSVIKRNGKQLDLAKFRTLYQNVLLSNLQEFVTEAKVDTPVMTITYSHINKDYADTVVKLYSHSDRRLLVTVNGTPIGYVLNSNLNDIKTALKAVIETN